MDGRPNRRNKAAITEFNWKPRISTVHSCFDVVGSRQHGVAAKSKVTGLFSDRSSTKCTW